MWSLFSRDPAKDFNYEIGEKIIGLEDKSLWTLHKGKRKSNGEPVSIFVFTNQGSSESQFHIAKATHKRLRTLRHPNILTYLDGLESDKVVYIVTECVVPLESHLNECCKNELAISWGLHQVAKGLSFLINDCSIIHNNVCISSVFVDKAGEWKLGGIDFMYTADSHPPIKSIHWLQRYDPPEKNASSKCKGDKWSADMWGFGCLIWEVFNGSLPMTSALKSPGKIPKTLIPHYCELVGANPKSRPNPNQLIANCQAPGGFFRNSFVDTILFLEEIQIKDAPEKTKFFNNLTNSLDSFPQDVSRYKILPQLLNAFEFGNAGSAVLAPMFKLGKLLDGDEYQKKIVPCVVKLFSSTDRATRVKLLQQLEHFAEHLQPSTVNDQIFPHVVQGFMDTNPAIREHTVKSMLLLAPKLNYNNLNMELMKHFARLQSKDEQGGIRTNTTVCLGKIANCLHPQMRLKILITAFTRALRDPFPPARSAGILAMAATQQFYTLSDTATKLLPSLCAATLDPDKAVRDQAFKTIKGFLVKLEKASENPELIKEMEAEVSAGGTPSAAAAAAAAASWAGWAVTSLTSKFYKSSPAETIPASNKTDLPVQSSDSNRSARKVLEDLDTKQTDSRKSWEAYDTKNIKDTKAGNSKSFQSPGNVDHDSASDYEENWNDDGDWGEMESMSSNNILKKENKKDDGGWNDGNWESLEETILKSQAASISSRLTAAGNTETSSEGWGNWDGDEEDFIPDSNDLKPISSYNWGNQEDKFFSSATVSKKPDLNTSRLQSHQSLTTNKVTTPKRTEGWDEVWENLGENQDSTSIDEAKKKREEKRLQRQKELQEKRASKQTGGPMKLGTKKI